jgi:hypothetical protein
VAAPRGAAAMRVQGCTRSARSYVQSSSLKSSLPSSVHTLLETLRLLTVAANGPKGWSELHAAASSLVQAILAFCQGVSAQFLGKCSQG